MRRLATVLNPFLLLVLAVGVIGCDSSDSKESTPCPTGELSQRIEYIMPPGAWRISEVSYTKQLYAGQKVNGSVQLIGEYHSVDWSYQWGFQIFGPGNESVHHWEGHWLDSPRHEFSVTASYSGKYTIKVSHRSYYDKKLVIQVVPAGWANSES